MEDFRGRRPQGGITGWRLLHHHRLGATQGGWLHRQLLPGTRKPGPLRGIQDVVIDSGCRRRRLFLFLFLLKSFNLVAIILLLGNPTVVRGW